MALEYKFGEKEKEGFFLTSKNVMTETLFIVICFENGGMIHKLRDLGSCCNLSYVVVWIFPSSL